MILATAHLGILRALALDQLLSENTYSSAPDVSYGTLTQMKYGNGDTVNYGYDEFKRMTSMQYGSDASKKFSYEYGANGQVARVTNHELDRTVLSEHDSCSRPMRITHLSGTEHLYTGEVTYDAQNNLHTFEEQVGDERTAYTTTFSYDVENKPTLLKYNDADTDKVAYAYDELGRMETRTVTVGGKEYVTSYDYISGEHGAGSTTGLIATIEQTGGNFTYTYDANGNISCVQQDGKSTAYTYDALGQLIRVDDKNDTTSGTSGTTWVYAYDKGGNILSKKRYAYTDTAVEITDTTPVLETMAFSYTNAAWKDQLKAVNGKPIAYDSIGNPTQYGADNDADKITYEWEKGRQLKKIVKPGETVEFKYNENGLRIQKILNPDTANEEVTNYTLHGKNIVHMTQGSNTLHFFYDASNKPAIVEYNGVKYAYVHNLQGDIVAILDNDNTAVVQYKYDAWGRQIDCTFEAGNNAAEALSTLNPFRYRGYVYDEETGLYYLASRYYCSNRGRFINADIYITATKSMFSYCANSPINASDSNGKDAIWINASNWLPLVGHTSLLIEYEGAWYYTYFGMNDVILEYVPDERLSSLSEFNEYVHMIQPDADPQTAIYDSATYIYGDFSAAYHQFEKDLDAFNKGEHSYCLISNNCTLKSWELLRLGIAPDGTSYGEYMDKFCHKFQEYSCMMVPNTNNATIRAMFPGHGFTESEAVDSINSDIQNYIRRPRDPFFIERYRTLLGV